MSEKFKNLEEDIDTLAMTDRAGYKNLVAILEYTKKTREMFRDMQQENKTLKTQILEQNKSLELMKTQLQQLLITVHQNRPTA
jgi:hypothetical protein